VDADCFFLLGSRLMLGRALDRVQLPSSRAAFIAASRSWSPRLRSFIDLATTIPPIQSAAMAGWVGHKPAPTKSILGTGQTGSK